MKTPGDPRNTYLASLEWADASRVAIQQLNRLQNQNDLLLGDAATGEVRRVYRDESKAWVDVETGALDRQWPGVSVGERTQRLASRLPRAARRVATARCSRVSTPTSPTSPASTSAAAGSTSSPRPRTPRERYLFRVPPGWQAHPSG